MLCHPWHIPGSHMLWQRRKVVDGRDKPGHDDNLSKRSFDVRN
jgi:hypothetical protein